MDRKAQIEFVLNQSTPIHFKEGREWYPTGNLFCNGLSKEFTVSLEIACGIVACLSPLKSWPVNMKIAKQFLEGKRNVHTGLQVTKAEAILRGEDIELCLGGLKTISFYHNLLNPPDPNYVTIDRHMLWMFKGKPSITPKQYYGYRDALKGYALDNNWIPSELQAVTWCAVKQIKHDT